MNRKNIVSRRNGKVLVHTPLSLEQEHKLARLETAAHEARKRHDWDAADRNAQAAHDLYESRFVWVEEEEGR